MQVKKFEARTMKEALELVKNSLGPDAIIVAAKDNQRGYGLGAESSIEVTAAVSEYALKKKQVAESKLTVKDREVLLKSSAKMQKQFINRVVENKMPSIQQAAASAQRPRRTTSVPYVDIQDDEPRIQRNLMPLGQGRPVMDMLKEIDEVDVDLDAMRAKPQPRVKVATPEDFIPTRPATLAAAESAELIAAREEVNFLRNEIAALRKHIEDFQKIPQKFMSVHPGAELGLPYELSFMFEKLNQMGMHPDLIHEILSEAQKQIPFMQLKKRQMVEGWVAKYILGQSQVVERPFDGTIHVFMGPNGQGKTSSLVKMASHLLVEQRRRVALVTTDVYKIGAADQMKIYAQILNVPFATIRNPNDWSMVMSQLSHVDHILVDMPGVQLRNATENDLVSRVLPPPTLPAKKHLVLSASIKDAEGREVINRYKAMQPSDLIFSSIDEAVQHGVIFGLQKFSQLPIHSYGTGPRVPEDWEVATKERLIDLLFKLTKVK